MMENFCITTDATIDLNQEIVDRIGVKVIPMDYMLGGKVYTHYPDSHELSLTEFYTRLKKGENASTSQISPARYEEFFDNILKDGKDLIYIALSSGLSGTYNAAHIAAGELAERYTDRKIICIDSLCASIGEGLLVYLAALLRNEGKSFGEVVEFITDTRLKVRHWFMVEDLEQLKRGGRLNSWEAVLGAALKIHPILIIDKDGRLKVASKARGVKKAIHCIIDGYIEEGHDIKNQTVVIGHGNCLEYAELVKKELMDNGLAKECIMTEIGPVIGSHTGTGMCALVFVGEGYRV